MTEASNKLGFATHGDMTASMTLTAVHYKCIDKQTLIPVTG